MNYVYVGIDPGASGGIVVLDGPCVAIYKMPDTDRRLYELITDISRSNGYVHVVCEKVWGHIGGGEGEKGGGASNGSAMFKFGQNFGSIRIALVACGLLNAEYVPPQTWQERVGVGTRHKGETKTKFKSRLRDKAKELFPHSTVIKETADAMLIAWFCRWRFTKGV